MNNTVSSISSEEQQFATFFLNDEEYAMAVSAVQEIAALTAITRVPHLPDFIKGVINLRGTIIPVIDLKLKFGMPVPPYGNHSCVIVTEYSRGVFGIIVDTVSDILMIPPEGISPTPGFGVKVRTDFIRGMGKIDNRLVIILDIEKVLSDQELLCLQEISQREVISKTCGQGGIHV
jgi:purine-binding chemotaxis protein CheW